MPVVQTVEQRKDGVRKPRMANLELLRCIAMMMVVALHYLGKGKLLGDVAQDSMSAAGVTAWVVEALCIVAVNVYMLISGYFLSMSSFKLSRLLKLWFQVWIYSVGIGLLSVFTGILPAAEADTHYFLELLFPISMGHYWFLTAYIFLYLMLPFLGRGLRKMTKGQMQLALGMLLFTFCLLKTVLPFRLEMDGQGYDCIWYLCVFVTAAYIRRFGMPFLEKWGRSLCLYLGGCLALLAELFLLRQIYLRTGSLGLILKISTEYNHLFPFLASVGLFGLFLHVRLRGKAAAVVTKIAPYTLGVYLLHENKGVRDVWQIWLGAEKVASPAGVIGYTMLAVLCVFTCGILADLVRDLLMRAAGFCMGRLPLGKAVLGKIEKADLAFRIQDSEREAAIEKTGED